MSQHTVRHTSLSSMMGRRVRDAAGESRGRVAEFLLDANASATHVASLVLSASGRARDKAAVQVSVRDVNFGNDGSIVLRDAVEPRPLEISEAQVPLERDLLDQQIIDVNGHKVVRVNDVDFVWEEVDGTLCSLRVAEVEVGMRGAIRRLLKGLPHGLVEAIAHRFQPRVIPWEFVDLIDRDPARRVRLKIGGDRLSNMHPSDIADILEELAPEQRDAVFESLDEEVAAEALEEVDPKLQRSLLEGMTSSRVADIVEEMDPGAAADLLAELPEERSEEILHAMEPEERAEVEELLEFPDDWAAGRMTTDYVSVDETATVRDAIEALRVFEGDLDIVTDVFLLNAEGCLKGVVGLARLLLTEGVTPLSEIRERGLHHCSTDATSREITELFDKYNLRSLPVVEEDGTLAGVIYPEHVIALLREGR